MSCLILNPSSAVCYSMLLWWAMSTQSQGTPCPLPYACTIQAQMVWMSCDFFSGDIVLLWQWTAHGQGGKPIFLHQFNGVCSRFSWHSITMICQKWTTCFILLFIIHGNWQNLLKILVDDLGLNSKQQEDEDNNDKEKNDSDNLLISYLTSSMKTQRDNKRKGFSSFYLKTKKKKIQVRNRAFK